MAEISTRSKLTRPLAFTSPEVHPLALDALLADKYGVDWILWEPETLWPSIRKDFGLKTEISRIARSGIQAVKTMHANDSFFLDWEVANWCTQALDGILPDFDILQPSYPGQIMHAVKCASLLRGKMTYDDEVQGWMAACFAEAGLVYAPDPVTFIQDDLVRVEAHCPKCGNVEWAKGLTECPECGEKSEGLRLMPRYEWKDIESRWHIVQNQPADAVVLKEDRPGVQLARLLVARDHMNDKLTELDLQLKDLGYGAGG